MQGCRRADVNNLPREDRIADCFLPLVRFFLAASNSSAGTSLMLRSNDRNFLLSLCGIQDVALILKNSRYVCLVVIIGSVVIENSPTSPYISLVRRLSQ